jgi:cell wall-associated NlpC family hydrolase
MKAQEIVAIARATIGTPYRHQGRIDGLALDCAGVPVHVAKQLGIPLTAYTRYGRLPVPAEMRAALDAHLQRVPREAMQIGDVAWLRFDAEPQHLAIVADYPLGGFSIIHADNGRGLARVVEHRLDASWARRIVAVWRYPGLQA